MHSEKTKISNEDFGLEDFIAFPSHPQTMILPLAAYLFFFFFFVLSLIFALPPKTVIFTKFQYWVSIL